MGTAARLAAPAAKTTAPAVARVAEARDTIAKQAPRGTALATQVAQASGTPLDDATRQDMETRFGHDFGSIRIHAGADAAAATTALGARAATLGDHVLLNRPLDGGSRHLLAHELAHTLQPPQGAGPTRPGDRAEQAAHHAAELAVAGRPGAAQAARAGGAAAPIRRDSDPATAQTAQEREIDEFFAGVYHSFYTGVESNSPGVLIAQADILSQRYVEVQGKGQAQSRLAIATVLSRIYDTLETDAASADRDADGALMESGFARNEPWTKQRPHAVSELPAFTPQNIIAWKADAALDAMRMRAEAPRQQAPRPTPPPMFFDADTITGEKPLDPTAGLKADIPDEQKKTADENDASGAPPAAGPAVRDGLAALKGKTMRALLTQTNQKDQADTSANADKPLLDLCSQIWFVSNRLYLLDRTGHLQPREESWFDISSLRGFKAGETYFLSPSGAAGMAYQAFTVKGGVREEGSSINFRSVLRGLIPVMDLRNEAAASHAGIGLIVAPNFAMKHLTISDLSLTRLQVAIRWVPGHLKWAVNAEINRIKENPLGEVANQAMAMGLEYLAKLIPGLGHAMMMFQLIQFSEWLGDVANVAAYAQTDDEMDIAAQAIAHKLAAFLVFEAISRARRGAVNLGIKGFKAATGRTPEVGKSGGGTDSGQNKSSKNESSKNESDKTGEAAANKNEAPPQQHQETKPPAEKTAPQEQQTKAPAEKAPPPEKPAQSQAQRPAAADAKPLETKAPTADKPAGPEGKSAEAKSDAAKAADQPAPQDTAPAAAKPAAAAGAAKPHAIDDVLNPDRKGFGIADPDVQSRLSPDQKAALARLDTAYQAYAKRAGDKALSPEKWLKAQSTGKPREDAQSLFGEDYKRGGTPTAPGARPTVAITDIPQPATYPADRMNADLANILSKPGLWDRLGALRARGLENGRILPALLNILKGNIGEILAKPGMEARLAHVREKMPDAKLEFGTRIARRRPDGGFDAPKLFGDGMIVSEKNGQLQLHDVFEVKSGGQGGAEATSQFFEWREGNLAKGDQIVLADGRRFTYSPGRDAPGVVRGMQTATPHIIATRGAEHLGTGSGDQVAVDATRTALPQTADELEFLARKVLESLPATQNSMGTPP